MSSGRPSAMAALPACSSAGLVMYSAVPVNLLNPGLRISPLRPAMSSPLRSMQEYARARPVATHPGLTGAGGVRQDAGMRLVPSLLLGALLAAAPAAAQQPKNPPKGKAPASQP